MSDMEYNAGFSPLEDQLDYRLIKPSESAYLIIRLDGNNFRSFTKGLDKPYDLRFINAMDETAKYLAENISGTVFAMVQSDEISIFVRTGTLQEDANVWFGGRIQKIVSVAASLASAKFATVSPHADRIAAFDARVLQVETIALAAEYAMYRRNEGRKNSITMAAATILSHKELMGMSTGDRRRAFEASGRSLDDLPIGFLDGRMLIKETYQTTVKFSRNGKEEIVDAVRSRWVIQSVVNDIEKIRELLS